MGIRMILNIEKRFNLEENLVTHASFALKADELDPVQITSRLGLEPTKSWRKGDTFETRSGCHTRHFGIWRRATGTSLSSDALEPHIQWLLRELEPRKELLLRIADEMSATANINLWWNTSSSTGGYDLPSSLLARMCTICERIDFVFCYHHEA